MKYRDRNPLLDWIHDQIIYWLEVWFRKYIWCRIPYLIQRPIKVFIIAVGLLLLEILAFIVVAFYSGYASNPSIGYIFAYLLIVAMIITATTAICYPLGSLIEFKIKIEGFRIYFTRIAAVITVIIGIIWLIFIGGLP